MQPAPLAAYGDAGRVVAKNEGTPITFAANVVHQSALKGQHGIERECSGIIGTEHTFTG